MCAVTFDESLVGEREQLSQERAVHSIHGNTGAGNTQTPIDCREM